MEVVTRRGGLKRRAIQRQLTLMDIMMGSW